LPVKIQIQIQNVMGYTSHVLSKYKIY